jgi:Ser/Thr protein kinase RdoA (MazF antagonist)
MKTLPDNPNLDHLRQQAKDLLAGLRDSEPATTLSEAQAALARRYGFRAWTDLKAEVDRRHGRAEVADPALAAEIAARYDLGRVTGEMRSLARPDEVGRRWSLATERGRWALRTLDTWIPIVGAETDVGLQEAAAAAGVLLPAPVRSRSGAVVESIGGHDWRVYQWLHSGPTLVAPVSASVTYQVGEILAKIHRLRLPVDRVSPWHAARFSQVEWSDLAATVKARDLEWAPAMAAAVPTLTDLESIGTSVPAPEPVLCHNALGPGNVHRGPNGRLIVVGWEHAGGQPPGWELCNALADWAIDPGGGINGAGARALVRGYRSVADSLPPLDIATFRGAATSIVNYLDGLVNWALHTEDPDDQHHANRTVAHLLAHLPSRAAYERLLDAVR